jgi:predicted dehydrogenase
MAEIRVAVVGTGFGCLTHVRALRAAGFEVAALVGRDAERTSARARRFDVAHPSTDLSEVLARDDIGAVCIATPPATHCELVHQVVGAGKHVVCEKPFATDAAQARTMLDAADAAGVVHLLGTEFRFATGQALMRRVIGQGLIGQPRLATFMLHMPLLADPKGQVPDWWSDAAQSGGWLGAHAAHVIDQVRSTLGEFADVSAGLNVVADRDWTAEDTYTVQFRTVGGVEGVMQSSAGGYGPILVISRIAGSRGTCWLDGDAVWVADADGTRQVPAPKDLAPTAPDPPPADLLVTAYDWLHCTGVDMGPYTRLFATFADLIQGRPVAADPVPATFADGVASMVVMDAARRSAAERVRVTLP